MLTLTFKTPTLSPFLQNPRKAPNSNPIPLTVHCKSDSQIERGIEFDTGGSFFRHESATSRDLGVLAAYLHKQSIGQLRVLDAMCGCGIRSLRYLLESKADFVWANDANDECRGVILGNLKKVERGFGDERKWVVSHLDANRVLTECYLRRDFFDLIDIDSFGSDSMFLRSALNSLKLGGSLYVTCTDGYSSGGHRPYHTLAAYGAYVRPLPYSNEVGLRMLIGGVVREALVLGYHVMPLFSYYSYHGPVFRVMLRVNRGKFHEQNRKYGFISYCNKCGNSKAFLWDELGQIRCCCSGLSEAPGLTVAGPLWIGPLHSTNCILEMLNLAKKWGWIGNGVGTDLDKLLRQMLDESDPRLPFGYIKLDEVAKRAKVNSPPLRMIMTAIQEKGYAASRSHIASNALKTNCPMTECISIAQELQCSNTVFS